MTPEQREESQREKWFILERWIISGPVIVVFDPGHKDVKMRAEDKLGFRKRLHVQNLGSDVDYRSFTVHISYEGEGGSSVEDVTVPWDAVYQLTSESRKESHVWHEDEALAEARNTLMTNPMRKECN